jgi:hypothetical protein
MIIITAGVCSLIVAGCAVIGLCITIYNSFFRKKK